MAADCWFDVDLLSPIDFELALLTASSDDEFSPLSACRWLLTLCLLPPQLLAPEHNTDSSLLISDELCLAPVGDDEADDCEVFEG